MPLYSPNGEYFTAFEEACQKLNPKIAEEIRAKITRVLIWSSPTNLTSLKEEFKACKELRQYKPWVIHTVDKGVAMVVLNKQDYINKAQNLLEQWVMYRT